MRSYGIYVAKRLAQFPRVVFIGISLTFCITHLTPIDPVEQMIASMTAFGDTSPEAVLMMREALQELYCIEGSLIEQYFVYWGRILALDFGPSLSAFPTPVSTLIGRALPWTIGLLFTCTVFAWVLGNLLGGLSGYYRKSRTLKVLGVVAMAFHPIPYYIIAFVLLIIFGYLWPVLPISGGSAKRAAGFHRRIHRKRAPPLDPTGAIDHSWSASAAGSSVCARRLQHRDRGLRHLRRARRCRSEPHPPVLCHAERSVPQVTGLAMSLGAIFNGAIIVEQVFSYPGLLRRLLIGAVYSADYSLVLGVTAISIIAVSSGFPARRSLSAYRSPRAHAR